MINGPSRGTSLAERMGASQFDTGPGRVSLVLVKHTPMRPGKTSGAYKDGRPVSFISIPPAGYERQVMNKVSRDVISSSHLISSHLIISSHLMASRSFHLIISCHLMSSIIIYSISSDSHLISSPYLISSHLMSSHLMSSHVIAVL